MIDYFALTDIGLHRENNQDSYATITNKNGDFLAVVCDGIGGAKAGDVASKEVANYLEKKFSANKGFKSLDEAKAFLIKIIEAANENIINLASKNSKYKGMGTTLTGIFISKLGILSINVGDSRVYGTIKKVTVQLTKDHSYVNQLIDEGKITFEESINHPQRHLLTKAIGVNRVVEPDINEVDKYDYYLICSDGLCGYVDGRKINEIMSSQKYFDSQNKCQTLIDKALLAGGYDNVTVIVVRYENI